MPDSRRRSPKDFAVDTRIELANVLLRVPSAWFRNKLARSLLRWDIGTDVVVGRHTRVLDLGGLKTGSVVNIGHHAHLDARGGIEIGDKVDMAPYVSIFTVGHDPDSPTFAGTSKKTVIGNRVWLATGSSVAPGSVLEDGVVLGAKSVAHGRLEANGVYAGNPAKLLRYRADGAQEGLKPYRRFWI
ncbi:hypothetical protein GCM10007304_39430 [Rhodococcoides trifolii]|uniref:Acyltransferase n=1 Tax=Rhodococcoides trifolii TaxID=908250 RepID=A0A917LGM6_9NOCA|nr:acyltransferase [Rhodococcus trifolii]GGG21724.1 hypothetical protein GCM10007304_39430 [Rhodococcus trifolii]